MASTKSATPLRNIVLHNMQRERVVAKLLIACNEIEDALNFSVRVARDDAVIIPEALRNELSVMMDDLRCMLRNLEDIP